jgi:ABC-type bacteriocin/lantibiotic exporter with double-glycine peptidase domain
MLKHSLNVSHQKQRQRADCLAACAAMVLDYYNLPYSYPGLLDLLDVKPFGAPSPNIQNLVKLGVSVLYKAGSLEELEQQIALNHPCIVFLDTGELSYWSETTFHAAVVVGMDDHYVYANDPAFDEAPQSVSWGDFDLAWLERGYYYVVITPL